MQTKIRHPAKYTDSFISVFADNLKDCKNVLDPFGGVGKIGAIKQYGFSGQVYCNEIEKEWLEPNEYGCDYLTFQDAEFLDYPQNFFDAICYMHFADVRQPYGRPPRGERRQPSQYIYALHRSQVDRREYGRNAMGR